MKPLFYALTHTSFILRFDYEGNRMETPSLRYMEYYSFQFTMNENEHEVYIFSSFSLKYPWFKNL